MCSLYFRLLQQKPACIFIFTYARHMPLPPHPARFNHPSILLGRKPWLSLRNFLQSLVNPSLFGPNILLTLPFSSILRLCSYFNASDWILYSPKTRKITQYSHTPWTSSIICTSIRTTGKVQKVYEFKYRTPSSKPHRTGKIQFCILLIFMFCNWKLDKNYGLHGSRHPLNLTLSHRDLNASCSGCLPEFFLGFY